jgi:hypothetical protein
VYSMDSLLKLSIIFPAVLNFNQFYFSSTADSSVQLGLVLPGPFIVSRLEPSLIVRNTIHPLSSLYMTDEFWQKGHSGTTSSPRAI